MPRVKKNITQKEKTFAKYLADGFSAPDAARKTFGWKCERFTREEQKAKSLAASKRVKDEVARLRDLQVEETVLEEMVDSTHPTDWDNLYQYAYRRLKSIMDDTSSPARVRYEALLAIEKISDPTQDVNLIMRYIDSVWDGLTGHCPCCHNDFALAKVENSYLSQYREANKKGKIKPINDLLARRLHLLDKSEKRRKPHEGQLIAIKAPERHIVALGPARVGKSFSLAMIGLLHLLLPGSNVWLLAKTYKDAEHEFNYLQNFLHTLFYPVHKHVYSVQFDRKTGDASIVTKWGSELTVKSGSSKGSITGQELDAMLVAEPGWVDGDLFEEIRARLSSRLGRIFAFGTPKGFGGFLGRLMKLSTRDMRTGKKLDPGARLIENGSPWSTSLKIYTIRPEQNPDYVISELEAAKGELTKEEYASEFEGAMVADTNKKFPHLRPEHERNIDSSEFKNMGLVLGIDQGERNFASCVLGWNGDTIYVLDEFYDNSDETIKANLAKRNIVTPAKIASWGLPPEVWKLTIFDADPPIWGQLQELENEGRKWKTDYTFRPKGNKEANWREETCSWVNQMAKDNKIVFSPECNLLLDDLIEALNVPEDTSRDSKSTTRKGWIINNPWRKDHTADAFLLAAWTILSNSVPAESPVSETSDLYERLEQEFQYYLRKSEQEELSGYTRQSKEDEIYEEVFGAKPKSSPSRLLLPKNFWYNDA